MGVKHREVLKIFGAALAALCVFGSVGCGGGSTANVVTVTISSSSGPQLILGQSTTLTATVSGATNTNVNWTPVCQFTTTTTDSTGKVNTTKPATCPPDPSVTPADPNHTLFGVFSNQQATGTEVFTATSNLPDPKTYPGLIIIATAQSQQNTSKTGTFNLTLNSGIGISFTPGTASVPVGEKQTFTAFLNNDIGKTTGVTWSLTQNIPSSTFGSTPNPYTPLPTCTVSGDQTGCGSITPDANNPNLAVYHAPAAVPTAITPAQKNNTSSPANVTIVAVSKADPTRVVIGIITIIPGGPITYNGISPTIAPQGATLWDIYLDAPNLSSASTIYLTDSSSKTTPVTSDSGQIKILFPVPTSSSSTSTTPATTCSSSTPCSTGARLRLNTLNLASAGPITVSVSDPAQPCNTTFVAGTPCPASGNGTFNVVPVRPTSTATTPDDIVQGSQTTPFQLIVDGGYFGFFNPNPAVPAPTNFTSVYFQSLSNNTLSVNPTRSTARQLVTSLDPGIINPGNPGLYPLYVKSNAPSQPNPKNPSVTNMAIFPDYSTTPPAVSAKDIPAGTNPDAVDVDTGLGVLVVAEAVIPATTTTPALPGGVQFYKIGQGTLTPIDQNGATCAVGCPIISQTFPGVAFNTPTAVSVNRTNHTVAVVNYGTQTITTNTTNNSCTQASPKNQSVTVLNVPGSSSITPFTVPLPFDPSVVPPGTLQGFATCPAPMPYSIGVDPDSNLALVAYSSVVPTTAANLGFIVNLNPNSGTNNYGCLLTDALTGQDPTSSTAPVGQCLFSQVTLNTGNYPQVAVTPHGHSALVTPGGSGNVREVDVTKPSTANLITTASLSAGIVTVVVSTQCPPGVPPTSTDTKNPCPLTLLPGAAGSVLITGLTAATTPANTAFFNGVFTVSVTSSNSFIYSVPNPTATDSCKPDPTTNLCKGEVFYGEPDQVFGLPGTSQGVAINPITSTAAITDANATGGFPQINLLNGLDQSPSVIGFSANCTAFTTSCTFGSPEFLPTAAVAWQPFTNSLLSYNPNLNQVSISDPVSHRRYALACASSSACQVNPIIPSQVTLSGGIGAGMATLTVQNGTPNSSLALFGGLAVDPATNQAFVLKSGSGTIDLIDLRGATPIKPTHISEVIVPTPPNAGQGSVGGIPHALVPQATLTCTVPVPPATSCDLPNVRILGSGFASGMSVRLDGTDITTIGGAVATPINGGREVDVTIPASELKVPHHFALDVVSSNFQSNTVDFIVVQQVDLSTVCNNSGAAVNTMPSSVAIADQIANGPFSPFALVSVTGCNSVVQIDLNPASVTFGQQIGTPIPVGTNPEGIAIWQHHGLAVVANNGAGTASVIDLTQSPPAPPLCLSSTSSTTTVPCADVSTGTNPTGVAINDATGAAIVTNTGSNTVTMINLGLLFPQPTTPPTPLPTSLTPVSIGGIQQPTAVAIDPDRGVSNQGIAVVTSIQISGGFAPTGALSVVEIGTPTPVLSTTSSSGFVSSIPTGIVFDPAVATNTTNPGVFFANSSGTNAITQFNPDPGGGGASVGVGINPTSLAINPQTGAMLTANSASNTISIVDTVSSPLKTHQTLGIPGSPTFGVAIDQFTNLAVIVDQANMRVLLFPMPN
ncbi:MAG TPA: hypothetical protein VJN89_09095 [Candidatus Acidoferrum sp.]|nr:hypothetical protein [Candidatus Acidoferrum sp.]